MLDAADFTQMQANLLEIIGDHSDSITIRRGETTIAAQSVRIERTGGTGNLKDSDFSEERQGSIVVVGGISLDIQIGDRFTVSNQLFRVTFVRSNAQIGKQAEAELVE